MNQDSPVNRAVTKKCSHVALYKLVYVRHSEISIKVNNFLYLYVPVCHHIYVKINYSLFICC